MTDLIAINPLTLPSVPLTQRGCLPTHSGIYFAVDLNDTVHYIGKAHNLRERWKNHHRYAELIQLRNIQLFYLLIEDVKDLDEIENELIARFKPNLNYFRSGCCKADKRLQVPALGESDNDLLTVLAVLHNRSAVNEANCLLREKLEEMGSIAAQQVEYLAQKRGISYSEMWNRLLISGAKD